MKKRPIVLAGVMVGWDNDESPNRPETKKSGWKAACCLNPSETVRP